MLKEAKNNLEILKLAIDETLWPTRCAVCDMPGYLLCPKCARSLSFIDVYKACPVCGEPFAYIQCCNCMPTSKNISDNERNNYHMNFDQALSVTRLDKNSGRIIALYKDGGERRLAKIIAYFMSQYITQEWKKDTNTLLSFIPASSEAYLKRGFDHMELVCNELSKIINIDYKELFLRPKSLDQRKLTRIQREENLKNRFKIKTVKQNILAGSTVILIDDVFTTGATMNSAAKILKENKVNKIYCISFARTF